METSTIIWIAVIVVITLIGIGAFSKTKRGKEDDQ